MGIIQRTNVPLIPHPNQRFSVSRDEKGNITLYYQRSPHAQVKLIRTWGSSGRVSNATGSEVLKLIKAAWASGTGFEARGATSYAAHAVNKAAWVTRAGAHRMLIRHNWTRYVSPWVWFAHYNLAAYAAQNTGPVLVPVKTFDPTQFPEFPINYFDGPPDVAYNPPFLQAASLTLTGSPGAWLPLLATVPPPGPGLHITAATTNPEPRPFKNKGRRTLAAVTHYHPTPDSENFAGAEVPAGALDGSNHFFTLSFDPDPGLSLLVFVNGLLQIPGLGADYTVASNTINFAVAPLPGDAIVVFYRYFAGPGSSTIAPVQLLNGWGANAHVGYYEGGVNQGRSFGLDPGTTYPFTVGPTPPDGSVFNWAKYQVEHTHRYAGIVWQFRSPQTSLSGLTLHIVSQVTNSIITRRSSSIWYSLDAGASWVMLYDTYSRPQRDDAIALPSTQDPNAVQVMAFVDSHDDMGLVVMSLSLTSQPARFAVKLGFPVGFLDPPWANVSLQPVTLPPGVDPSDPSTWGGPVMPILTPGLHQFWNFPCENF